MNHYEGMYYEKKIIYIPMLGFVKYNIPIENNENGGPLYMENNYPFFL